MARPDAHEPLTDVGAGRDVHAQALARILAHEASVGPHQQPLFGLAEIRQASQAPVPHAVSHGNARSCVDLRAPESPRCSR